MREGGEGVICWTFRMAVNQMRGRIEIALYEAGLIELIIIIIIIFLLVKHMTHNNKI